MADRDAYVNLDVRSTDAFGLLAQAVQLTIDSLVIDQGCIDEISDAG